MVKVTTLSELTIDGKLALGPGASSKDLFAFSPDALKAWFHEQRAANDAIMVGAGTVRADDPELTVRYAPGDSPLRVIPSSDGRLPPGATVLNDGRPTLVAVSARARPDAVAALSAKPGVEVVVCGDAAVDLTALMAALSARGVTSLIAEGGSTLLTALLQAGLVSRLIVKHIPVITGSPDAPTYLNPPPSGLPLSRWRLEEGFVKGGILVGVYAPLEAAA
jgi:5-amino-6-(5-phosphoribosylamino)uracil reductase/2,5-diamino-6-(ribosylamino)-4(3H)-pyrimidinone 5'-phosphate reductase